MRMSRSRARANLSQTTQTRVAPSVSPKANLRTRFHRTGTLTKGWRAKARKSAQPTSSQSTATSLTVTITVSSDTVVRRIPSSYTGDRPQRWEDIAAGRLPEDEDVPRPLTDSDIEAAESEALDEIHAWGRQREAQIRAEAEAEAESLREDADSLGPRAARYRASIERDVAQIWSKAEKDMEDVGDQVREERDKARKEIMKDAEARQEAADERLTELKSGLDREIETFVSTRYMNGVEVGLEDYELN